MPWAVGYIRKMERLPQAPDTHDSEKVGEGQVARVEQVRGRKGGPEMEGIIDCFSFPKSHPGSHPMPARDYRSRVRPRMVAELYLQPGRLWKRSVPSFR